MPNNTHNKKYTIAIPVVIDFEGNDMSPQTKTIKLTINAISTDIAMAKLAYSLETLINNTHMGH